MIIDLNQFEQNRLPFEFKTIPNLDEELFRICGEVAVQGVLIRNVAQIEIEGNIKGEVETECFRCLSKVNLPIDLSFRDLFVSKEQFTNEQEKEVRGEDLSLSVYEDQKIDISDIVREEILLNIATQILCREDCKGLCATCGANRNETMCNCFEKEIDPRWAALKNLK